MKINLANRLTLLRIFLVPALAVMLLDGRHTMALVIFIVAAATDAIDGIIARRWNQRTTLGAVLDPLADKALLITSFILMSQLMAPFVPVGDEPSRYLALPNPLVAVVIFRDILIVTGVGVIHVVSGQVRWGPSWISKVTTNAQIYTVFTVALGNCLIELGLENGFVSTLKMLLQVLIGATVITTVVSGLDYSIRGARMLSEQTNGSPSTHSA